MLISKVLPTQIELKELFNYCPDSGVFTRLKSVSINTKNGDIAGNINMQGYRRISINRINYLSHRLAWLYTHGAWPESMIDHINGIKDDNRISNLREATRSQNYMNVSMQKNNTSGYKGVSFDKRHGKWQAVCGLNGKIKHIGYFDTAELASLAYEAFAKISFGEFYPSRLGVNHAR